MRTSLTLIARTRLILMLWCSALEILNKGIVARFFRLVPHIFSAVDIGIPETDTPWPPKRKKVDIPVYSFVHHQRQPQTTPLYSPHVLILEGILALHDPRIMDLLDVKVCSFSVLSVFHRAYFHLQIFVEADMDVCLGRRGENTRSKGCTRCLTNTELVLRDVKERGRDIDGIIKQWFTFVKPSYKRYIEPQRSVSGKVDTVHLPQDCRRLSLTANLDIIIPRGIENKTAIGKVCVHIIQVRD